MTFLELVRAYVREAGVERVRTDIPVSVADQQGELANAVHWVRQAWIELQASREDWQFMRGKFTLETVQGQRVYEFSDCEDVDTGNAIDRFSDWYFVDRHDPPRCFLQSTGKGGEFWLTAIPYDRFNQIHALNVEPEGMPIHISEDPQRRLLLGQTPNDVYVVTGQYRRGPQILQADGDTPDMPEQFHYLIVYDALRKYGGSDAAGEVLLRCDTEGGSLRRSLYANQLPGWRGGRSW